MAENCNYGNMKEEMIRDKLVVGIRDTALSQKLQLDADLTLGHQLKFLGHLVDEQGIHADPDKVTAITKMVPPTNISELRRFMGMVNQLGKFSMNLADLTQPLRQLLSKKSTWIWGPAQDQAFAKVKEELTKPTVLRSSGSNKGLC